MRLVPRESKQAAKRALAKIGLLDEWAPKLEIKNILDSDVFLVSYPKSGNTWVRYLIANMLQLESSELSGDTPITFALLDKLVPDSHVPECRAYLEAMGPPRFIKTHVPAYKSLPRFIYIYRDGRDVMVSYYHYLSSNEGIDCSFSEFLQGVFQNRKYDRFGPWQDHVARALDFARAHPSRVCLIRYEAMLARPVESAAQIAAFCKLDVTPDTIEKAVALSSFSELQKIEKEHGSGGYIKKQDSQFFRSGRKGQWPEIASAAENQRFLDLYGDLLKRLGYTE